MIKLRNSAICTLTAALLALPSLAAAGGHATLLADSEERSAEMKIEYDGELARMQTDRNPDSYFIVRGSKAYAVSEQDGNASVFDLNQVAEMMQGRGGPGARFGGGGMGGRFGGDRAKVNLDVAEITGLNATGKEETVAGIKGEIYTLNYKDSEGNALTTDAVLSSNAKAREFTAAMLQIGGAMREKMAGDGERRIAGASALWQQIQDEKLGLLRFGPHFKVLALDSETPASARFELPGPVTPINNMRDLLQLRGLRAAQ